MAVTSVLSGVLVSLFCCLKATLGEEIAKGFVVMLMIILYTFVGLFDVLLDLYTMDSRRPVTIHVLYTVLYGARFSATFC